jgi:hypothetical protein
LALTLTLTLALAAAAGCGEADEFDRVGVSGKVTVGDKPLSTGTISFVPRQSGPSVQGTIAEGEYSIARPVGPAPGPYRVEIYSIQPTGRKVPDNDNAGALIEETRNTIPDRYNLKSELYAEVTREGGQQFDFTVKNRE